MKIWNDSEDPFRAKREWMVETQIRARGVRDPRVLEALRVIPRHLFVPPEFQDEAYEDYPLPIGYGQTISQPYMVAAMTEALALEPHHRVLEIGTGSGYQTAVLAYIAREVYTVEYVPELSERARRILQDLGFTNIHFRVGDGSLGWPEAAPFDRILVTAAAPEVPPPLWEQLAPEGIMVIPIGDLWGQELYRIRKTRDGEREEEALFPCAFVPLRGAYGFKA